MILGRAGGAGQILGEIRFLPIPDSRLPLAQLGVVLVDLIAAMIGRSILDKGLLEPGIFAEAPEVFGGGPVEG